MVKVDGIMEKLTQIALDDGVISTDEVKVIQAVMENIEKYSKVLDMAIKDNIITSSEKQELIEKRRLIFEKAYDTASDDLIITSSEFALLEETLQILYRLELNENEKLEDI